MRNKKKKKFIILKTKKIYKDSERFERDRKIEKKEDFFQKEIWVGVGLKQKGLNNVGRENHYLYIYIYFFTIFSFSLFWGFGELNKQRQRVSVKLRKRKKVRERERGIWWEIN